MGNTQIPIGPVVPMILSANKRKENTIKEQAAASAGLNVAFYIDPFMMQGLCGANGDSIADTGTILSGLSQIRDEVVETMSLSVMTCTEYPVTDVESPKYIESQMNAALWLNKTLQLNKHARELSAIVKQIDECRKLYDEALETMQKVYRYLRETSSAFIEAEQQIKSRNGGL